MAPCSVGFERFCPACGFITLNESRSRGGHTMADRSLRGMRLGTQSLQSEEGVEFSPRKKSIYRTADGTTFEVVFAADAEVPGTWESPKSGQEGVLLDFEGVPVVSEQVEA